MSERRSFEVSEVEFEERAGRTLPIIRGHAAVFHHLSQDLGGFREQVVPGAFADSILADDVRALFNHDASMILGRNKAGTLKLSESARGLAIEIDPPDTQYARDLVTSMRRGDVSQMSFGFTVPPGGQDWAKDSSGATIRTLKKVRLFDVSPVTFPAYLGTDVAVRDALAAFDEFRTAEARAAAQHSVARTRMRLRLEVSRRRTA